MADDNKWDRGAEPTSTMDGKPAPLRFGDKGTPTKEVMEMIRPAFPEKCNEADVEAILERVAVILNSKDFVYARPARLDKDIQRFRHEHKGSYITEEAKTALQRYTDH